MDVHKYAHQAVALNCLGQELSQLSFTNDELAHCRTWLNGLGAQEAIVVGLEDVNGVGTRLSQFLLQEGFTCRYVPAILTERERKHSVQHDKSDGSVSKVEMAAPMVLIHKGLFPSISTFKTPPKFLYSSTREGRP